MRFLKIMIAVLVTAQSLTVQSQIKVKDLPVITTGFDRFNLIVDTLGTGGTKRMSIANFRTNFVSPYFVPFTGGTMTGDMLFTGGTALRSSTQPNTYLLFNSNSLQLQALDSLAGTTVTIGAPASNYGSYSVDVFNETKDIALDINTSDSEFSAKIIGSSGFKGLQYASDYQFDYDDRSLIDKGYADATYAPISGAGYLPLSGNTILTPMTGNIIVDGSFSLNHQDNLSTGYSISGKNNLNTEAATDDGANYAFHQYAADTGNTRHLLSAYKDGDTGGEIDMFIGHGANEGYINVAHVPNGAAVFKGIQYFSPVVYEGASLITQDRGDARYAPIAGGGYLSTALSSGKIFVGNGSNVATGVDLTLNSSPGSFSLANTGSLTIPDANTSTRGFLSSSDWNNIVANGSSGVVSFTTGITVDGGSLTFSVGAVTGWIVDNTTTPSSPTRTFVNYAGATGITPTYLASANITYILLNSSGTLVQQTTYPTDSQRRSHLWLGAITHPNHTTIAFAKAYPDVYGSIMSQLRDMVDPLGKINSGVTPYANGANLNFNITGGELHALGINFVSDRTKPNSLTIAAQTPASFVYRTQTGNGAGFITAIDPTNYDNAGTITAIAGSSNQATIQYIYLTINGLIGVQYGQTVYTTLTDAVQAVGRETFVTYPNFRETATLIGVLVVKKGATQLNNTADARFLSADKLGGLIGSSAGIAISTLQSAYNNSTLPQITTDATRDGIRIKRGSAADTDTILAVQNGAGNTNWSVLGNGKVTGINEVLSTSLTCPAWIGGTGASSSAEIRATSGTGSSEFIKFTGGTNGATEYARFINGGNFCIGSTSAIQSGMLTLSKDQNSSTRMTISNTSSGTGAICEYYLYNGTSGMQLGHTGTSYTTSGGLVQDGAFISGAGTGGLSIAANNLIGNLRLYTGAITSSNERMRIQSTGEVRINPSVSITGSNYTPALSGAAISSASTFINFAGINTNTSGGSGFIFGDNTNANGFALVKYGSALAGNISGTSVPFANTAHFFSGSGGDLPIAFQGNKIYNIIATTSTNKGTRLDAAGLRIDQNSNLHTAATAYLHIGAGTATANTAPIKLTTGTNLSSVEAGAVEYSSNVLYFTPNASRYQVGMCLTGSATLDFGSTSAQNSSDLTITVTGAADGDAVSVGAPNGSVLSNSDYTAWVSSTNTVTVRFNNYSSGSQDPASGSFKVVVNKN